MKTESKTKLTTCETRARDFCRNLLTYDGGVINVEWKKSAMYGYNPAIMHHGGKCTNVSGCGYDKLSTALADCLRFLFPIDSEAHRDVWITGGCGDSRTIDTLAKHGWTLERTATGSTFDAYNLTKINGEEVAK